MFVIRYVREQFYLLVAGIKRLLLHRHPSSIILRRAFLFVLNWTLEELFTLFLVNGLSYMML